MKLIVMVLECIFWWNPLVYLFRNACAQLLEDILRLLREQKAEQTGEGRLSGVSAAGNETGARCLP